MKFIAHRINTIKDIKKIPKKYGLEVDLRDNGDRLILQHEPFKSGQDFEEYLKHFGHGTIILNIKSEGIEFRILDLLKKYKIRDYFFLDSSFPMINRLSKQGEKNIALRFSEFEGLDTIMNMKDNVKWVWVDCFSKYPLENSTYELIKNSGLKLCIESPDLVGREEEIYNYKQFLFDSNINYDAICTKYKNIKHWK